MKSHTKREKKKYPYNRFKHSLITQMKAMEKRKGKEQTLSLTVNTYMKYALVNSKGDIIERFRLYQTAKQMRGNYNQIQREELKIVKLDENGKPVVTKER